MSIEVICSQLPSDTRELKCRACDDPPYTEVNWQYASQDKGDKLHDLFNQLKPARKLKFGHLYTCQLCGSNWVLSDEGRVMSRVPNDRMVMLDEWDAAKLSIDPEHLLVLDGIGGTAPRYWMGNKGVISVPCAISTRSGERIDPAIVWITRRPPIDAFTSRVRLYRDIGAIEPSRFALPLDVRCATVSAGEVSMGFSPTRVVAANGTPFVLHWATSLFNQAGITGSEIHLSKKRFSRDEQLTIAEADMTFAAYFLADWFENAENLDKMQPQSSLYSKLRSFWKW